jgi:hypothetical protein
LPGVSSHPDLSRARNAAFVHLFVPHRPRASDASHRRRSEPAAIHRGAVGFVGNYRGPQDGFVSLRASCARGFSSMVRAASLIHKTACIHPWVVFDRVGDRSGGWCASASSVGTFRGSDASDCIGTGYRGIQPGWRVNRGA